MHVKVGWVMGLAMGAALAGAATDAAAQGRAEVAARSQSDAKLRAIAATAGNSRRAAMEAAKKIDELVTDGYVANSVKPNPVTDDEVFLRRAYLQIAGRIPTLDEAKAFLASRDAYKRYKLIDDLLESDGYVSHQYNYWADLLRVKHRLTNQVYGGPYIDWIKDSIRENKPYDKFVYELMAAAGRVTDDGAAGYFLRDTGMPLDNMANTTRIFLGTQIGCAQCHDHPFDKWTQMEFYELAAYTAGVSTRSRPENVLALRRMVRSADLSQREQQVLRRLVAGSTFGVSDTKRALRLPDDYKYDDGKPKQIVEPMTIFGDTAEPQRGEAPRMVFARWLTSPTNPRFTLNIANRMWARAFGVGLIEPIDDITDGSKPSNPALMAHLEQLMRDSGYDLKHFMRCVYYSRTWQRAATQRDLAAEQPYHFPGPVLRRMTAAQVWDSLITLGADDVDTREGFAQLGDRYAAAADIDDKSPQQIIAMAKELANDRDRMTQMRRDAMQRRRGDGLAALAVRASEQQQPARPGHVLEQFGQSDRELIDNGSEEPSVTQALQMLNGPLTNVLTTNTRSLLAKHVAEAKTPREKIDVLFLSVLGRMPTSADYAIAEAELREDSRNGYANIAAALLNTREFLFVQ